MHCPLHPSMQSEREPQHGQAIRSMRTEALEGTPRLHQATPSSCHACEKPRGHEEVRPPLKSDAPQGTYTRCCETDTAGTALTQHRRVRTIGDAQGAFAGATRCNRAALLHAETECATTARSHTPAGAHQHAIARTGALGRCAHSAMRRARARDQHHPRCAQQRSTAAGTCCVRQLLAAT